MLVLMVGDINDKNVDALHEKTVFSWIDPTKGMSLPKKNEWRNRFLGFLECYDCKESDSIFVIWSNDQEVINAIGRNAGEHWYVEGGIIQVKNKSDLDSIVTNSTHTWAELYARHWVFQ